MGVRWRWTLVLIAAAVGLMVVAGVGVESTLRARMGAESRDWERARAATLEAHFSALARSLESAVQAVAADPELEEAFGVRQPTDAQRLAREDWVVVRARREQFDELLVLDESGRILACSAHPGRIGQPHEHAPRLLTMLTRTGQVWREHVEGDPGGSNWRISVVDDVVAGAGRVRLVGSSLLDEPALRDLRAEIGLGSLRFGPPTGDEVLLEWPVGIETVRDAHLSYAAGLPPDLQALRSLRVWLFAAVGVALLIGVLGAPWIAAGFGRPLEEMAAAVQRIGQGARTIELESGGPPEVRQLQVALRQLVRDLKETEERVRQAERQATWRELARHIAHEIRNVLSPLALALDNVETGVDRDRAALAASLAVARDQVESLRRLASEFSEHAREPEPAFKLVALEDLLQAVAQAARAAFTGIDLAVVAQDPPDSVDGDAEQLRRALHNLIKNAVEVAPGAPVVLRCGSGPGDARWWVEVEDRGPGLPSSVEDRLGDEQVSSRDGGSGLGLAVVTTVARAHGGRVEVARPVSGGTIIRMALARRAPAPAPGGAA
jgi:signal transduction histidine kinase